MTDIKVRASVIEKIFNTFANTEELYNFIVSTNSLAQNIQNSTERNRHAVFTSTEPIEPNYILIQEFEKIIYICLFLQRNLDLLMPILKEFEFEYCQQPAPDEEDED